MSFNPNSVRSSDRSVERFDSRGNSGASSGASMFREKQGGDKPVPRISDLADYGITLADWMARHTVVCCEKCEEKFGKRSFLMLRYVSNRPGERAQAVAFHPHSYGNSKSNYGEPRIVWTHAIGLCATCQEGHRVSIHPQTGEVTCRDRCKED